ncbi:hypothetical protein [Nostoc sp.]|uniref:hypothetical protein n=1 Tax=Nostoc sp. TaxID=1180 RepID=UPI002FF4551B
MRSPARFCILQDWRSHFINNHIWAMSTRALPTQHYLDSRYNKGDRPKILSKSENVNNAS